MRGVDFITPICRPRGDDSNRRLCGLHGADLHRRSMGAEETTVRQIESVLLVARWMIWRGVECVEAMPLGLNIWAVGQCKSHSPKNADTALEHLRKWMQSAFLIWRAGQRNVDIGNGG